jgi:hypothetical protein
MRETTTPDIWGAQKNFLFSTRVKIFGLSREDAFVINIALLLEKKSDILPDLETSSPSHHGLCSAPSVP